MSPSNDILIPGYQWIAKNPDKFGESLSLKAPVFLCPSSSVVWLKKMTYDEIVSDYSEFPKESIEEVLKFASQVTDKPNVAA